MSRFFKNVNDSSSSDSESSSASDSESNYTLSDSESELSETWSVDQPDAQKTAAPARSRFLRTEEDSDDGSSEDERKRTVRSQKEKKQEEVDTLIKSLENARKINDWVVVERGQTSLNLEFDAVLKLCNKVSPETFGRFGVPAEFLRLLEELDLQCDKSKLNALNTRSLNAMKQKLKKAQKQFDAVLQNYRTKKELPESEEEPSPLEAASKSDALLDASLGTSVLRKLNEIMSVRGKKNTDKTCQVTSLRELLAQAALPSEKAKILIAVVSSQFDYSTKQHMSFGPWKMVESDVRSLIAILEQNDKILVKEEDDEEPSDITGNVKASIVSFTIRLDEEFNKALLNIDPHSAEYSERLQGESLLYDLLSRSENYFEKRNDLESLCIIRERKLDHLYYKSDAAVSSLMSTSASGTTATQTIQEICRFLYKNGTDRTRIRALLHHIYNHALHDRFIEARDLLLMSHIQETITSADVAIQILYNRTIVQLGFCAFRQGLLKEAHSCLLEIVTSGHYKELLAQGSRDDMKQEKTAASQRHIPYHMHINLDLIESVFLVCSMILEVPNILYNQLEIKKKFVSKSLKRLLDYHDRSLFHGIPESSRDRIVAASKCILNGEYESGVQFVVDMKIWEHFPRSSCLKQMLTKKILEECCCRAHLYTIQRFYSTVSFAYLDSTLRTSSYSLGPETIKRIATKLILNDEIKAQIDCESQYLVFSKEHLSKLQFLNGVLIEKLALITERKAIMLRKECGMANMKEQAVSVLNEAQ